MELKEAIERLKYIDMVYDCNNYYSKYDLDCIETVLQALDNSIPKEKIEKYLSEETERFNTYKKGSKTNENLKLGMWKHLGAKNICEQILGIEKNITTLD